MSKFIDITGQRFGRLVAINRSLKSGTNIGVKWLCECECGKEKYIRSSDLRLGKVTSCGCWKDEKTSKRFKTHGRSNSLLYNIWTSIKGRCYRKTCKDYPSYGGRGISMCNNWAIDFQEFYNWAINNGYKEHLTIERIDPDGNYEPTNCKWIENEKQALNRRNTKIITYMGKSKSVRDWSNDLGINYNTFRDYINKGKSIAEIVRSKSA